MKANPFSISRSRKKRDLSWLLFFLSAILSVITTYYVSAHYIDSDTSSELVLARHLIDTGKLLSQDWFYATELRFLHVQWIYVPLMLLLDDWLMVRYIGALVMQALYIAAFGYLVHAAGKNRSFFFRGAALLLLPVSVTYGRVVLYHNHYLINMVVAFLVLALSLKFAGTVEWRSKKTWLYLILLAAISFTGGMNSIRQLMITHAPILLLSVVFWWIEDAKNSDQSTTAFLKPANYNFLLCAVYSAFFSFLGLMAQGFISSKLGLHIAVQSENNALSFAGFDSISGILYGYFHQFGYRSKNIALLSVSGILSLGGIFTGCYLIILSIKQLLQNKPHRERRSALLSLFFWAHTAVILLIFLITKGSEDYYHPLYLSLSFPWAVPLLLIHLEEMPSDVHPLHVRKFFAILTVILLLLSSAVNHAYFQGSNRFPQTYEGLSFHKKDHKAELTEVVDLLLEQGYDKGYASYWDCNVVAEMTSGKITMVLIHDPDDSQSGNLSYRNWLSATWSQEAPCEKPFLLINEKWAEVFRQSDSYVYCTPIYSGHNYIAYSIDNPEEFADTCRY